MQQTVAAVASWAALSGSGGAQAAAAACLPAVLGGSQRYLEQLWAHRHALSSRSCQSQRELPPRPSSSSSSCSCSSLLAPPAPLPGAWAARRGGRQQPPPAAPGLAARVRACGGGPSGGFAAVSLLRAHAHALAEQPERAEAERVAAAVAASSPAAVALETFLLADLDGDGRISQFELQLALESGDGGVAWSAGPARRGEAAEMMRRYDANRSGFLEVHEFGRLVADGVLGDPAAAGGVHTPGQTAAAAARLSAAELRTCHRAFEALDGDADGAIDVSDLQRLCAQLGAPQPLEALVRLCGEYDDADAGALALPQLAAMAQEQPWMRPRALDAWLAAREAGGRGGSGGEAADGSGADGGAVAAVYSEASLQRALRGADAAGGRLLVLSVELGFCRRCRGMAAPLAALAAHYRGGAAFARLVGTASRPARRLLRGLGVGGPGALAPEYLVFQGGRQVGGCRGADRRRLEEAVRAALPPGEPAPAPLYGGPNSLGEDELSL